MLLPVIIMTIKSQQTLFSLFQFSYCFMIRVVLFSFSTIVAHA
uniref:Uncharacterized protein n=1 Tax=Rhizophora mucronata TaxID=61149 RepID=A0A2P2PPE0_RHIMU